MVFVESAKTTIATSSRRGHLVYLRHENLFRTVLVLLISQFPFLMSFFHSRAFHYKNVVARVPYLIPRKTMLIQVLETPKPEVPLSPFFTLALKML